VVLLGLLGTCLLVLYQFGLWGWRISKWDWLLLTGVAVFVVAYGLSRTFPRRVADTVERLWDRGVIGPEPGTALHGVDVAALVTDLEETAKRYRLIGAPVAAMVMVALWFVAFTGLPWGDGAFWLDVTLAAVAGAALGRLIAYGRLGNILVRNGLPPHPRPGHVDEAAGLSPVGVLYLGQASVVAAMGLFAGVWWLIIGETARYAQWRGPYVAVMVIAVACEFLAFFAPLWSFHLLMSAERQRLVKDADSASRQIQDLIAARASAPDLNELERIDTEIERHTRVWRDIETMPTWPMNAGIRRRFTWNNLVVAIPFILKAIAAPTWWQDVTDGVAGILR
jgi:hypothetical protein